jgi:hypothetical protein
MFSRRFVLRAQRVGQYALAGALLLGAHRPDRRVVDTVLVGDAASEALHGFDGAALSSGRVGAVTYRSTTGWMHYTLRTYDDTDVTLVLSFVRPDTMTGVRRRVDVLVENTLVASPHVHLDSVAFAPLQLVVPFALTKGKGHIAVVLRATDGPTPALAAIRTLQEHYELSPLQTPIVR